MTEAIALGKLAIDSDRLVEDLENLSRIGRVEEGGIHRRAFSEADMAGRRWLIERIEEAGLTPRVDGAGNLGARWPGRGGDGAPVLTGSHLDTVPGAGQLDGALGVVAGLEVLRVLSENEVALARDVELVAFSDEEGRFGGMLGSQAMSGQLTPEFLDRAVDLDGIRLRDAMAECGFRATDALSAEREPDSIHAFVELHIEQGPVLDRAEQVTIGAGRRHHVGLFRWNATASWATPNPRGHHAHGSCATTMLFRRLAEVAAQPSPVSSKKMAVPKQPSPPSVASSSSPGAANVVPSEPRRFQPRRARYLDPETLSIALGDGVS